MWSSQGPASRSSIPAVPTGEVVASVEQYEEARAVVDRLIRSDFPASQVSIVGSDLRSVERVTGRMNVGRAALSGLLSGVFLGVFVALFVVILTPTAPIGTLLAVVLMAVGFSVLWNVLGYTLNRRHREFTSVMQVTAARFDVVVAPETAAAARQALGTTGQAFPPVGQSAPQQPVTGGPSAWGAPAAPPNGSAAAPAESPAAAQPPVPEGPKRTYGEAQDELRRRAAARAHGQAPAADEPADDARRGDEAAGSPTRGDVPRDGGGQPPA